MLACARKLIERSDKNKFVRSKYDNKISVK